MKAGDTGRLRRVIDAATIALGFIATLLLFSALAGWDWTGFSLESFARFLAFVGLLFTALFGLIGRLTDIRDEEGRITGWGRTALLGAGISLLVSIASFVVGIFNDLQRSIAVAERNEQALTEIRRASSRIEGISLFMPLQYTSVFGTDVYRAVEAYKGEVGVEIVPGQMHQYVTACARDFPAFGRPELANKFAALNGFGIEMAIVDSDLGNELKRALTALSTSSPPSRQLIRETIERILEWRGLSGSLDVRRASLEAGCSEIRGGAEITFSMGPDDFILVQSPLSDVTRWRSDGSITSSEDLAGKVGILWSSLFSESAILGAGAPGLDYLSIAYPPAGISCFHAKNPQNPGIESFAVGQGGFALLIHFDRADGRKSKFC